MTWQHKLSVALRTVRKRAGKRQCDLVAELGVSKQWVCQVENWPMYHRSPSMAFVIAWLAACKANLVVTSTTRGGKIVISEE